MVSDDCFGNGDRDKEPRKAALIMDEVDDMFGGDRVGIADLIASIKFSKLPIICVCNDRYSRKLRSLRKPTKQQMAKWFKRISQAEGLQVDEVLWCCSRTSIQSPHCLS